MFCLRSRSLNKTTLLSKKETSCTGWLWPSTPWSQSLRFIPVPKPWLKIILKKCNYYSCLRIDWRSFHLFSKLRVLMIHSSAGTTSLWWESQRTSGSWRKFPYVLALPYYTSNFPSHNLDPTTELDDWPDAGEAVFMNVFVTWQQVVESYSLSYLLQRSSSGSQLHHAQGHSHTQRGKNDVVLTPRRLQLVVQSDWEFWCSVLRNVRHPATVARQQDGEEEERGQKAQDPHCGTDNCEREKYQKYNKYVVMMERVRWNGQKEK